MERYHIVYINLFLLMKYYRCNKGVSYLIHRIDIVFIEKKITGKTITMESGVTQRKSLSLAEMPNDIVKKQ